MSYFLNGQKWQVGSKAHSQSLLELTAGRDQPFYVYDLADALERADVLMESKFSVHYAMKANSQPRLLKEFASRGLGVDVVSVGELKKALASGVDAGRVIFSGVAKDKSDLEFALSKKIFQINVESFEELQLLQELAVAQNVEAPVALRLNIHLTAPTHAHVQTATPDSKFGLDLTQLPEVLTWLKNRPGIQLKGIATHIGSQITDHSVFTRMAGQMGEIYRSIQTQGFKVQRLDLGGGLGLDYHSTGAEDLERMRGYIQALSRGHGTDAEILIEPGRCLVARMGVLLARVIYVKTTPRQKFMILNAGMNTLMRPALYQAYHRIHPVVERPERETYTVVGPICESTDKFAVDRATARVERGDWVAIFESGAYGAVMANTYNESPLPEEFVWYNKELIPC